MQQADKSQRQGAALVEGSSVSDVRVDKGNAFFRLLDPAEGKIVGAAFMDRNTDVVGARVHDLGKQLPHALR